MLLKTNLWQELCRKSKHIIGTLECKFSRQVHVFFFLYSNLKDKSLYFKSKVDLLCCQIMVSPWGSTGLSYSYAPANRRHEFWKNSKYKSTTYYITRLLPLQLVTVIKNNGYNFYFVNIFKPINLLKFAEYFIYSLKLPHID